MRAALRPSFLGVCALVALACGGNAPLTTNIVDEPGSAGARGGSPAGSSGAGTAGAAGGHGGASGAPSTGAAGAASSGAAGTAPSGTAGAPSTGAAGTTSTGAAGATATGQAGAGGQSDPGVTMCVSPTLPSGQCAQGAYKRNGGACQCQDGAPCVCGAACTDLLLDDDNCGVCGNRCAPTATCNGGKCGRSSALVVAARSGCTSIDVAVGGNTVYWTDAGHGVVQSIPVGGGDMTTLATGEPSPSRVLATDSSLFWLDKTTVLRRLGVNLAVTTVVEAAAPVGGFVVSPDGATVYFSSDTMIYRVPAMDGVPVVVAREERGGLPGGLALTGNLLAFPTGLNGDVDMVTLVDGQVASCGGEAADGTLLQVNCARLARGQGELFLDTILAIPGEVLWLDGTNLKIETTKGGGTFDSLAQTNNDSGTGLAMNATTVYFAEGAPSAPGAGVIYKAPAASNQTAIRLARGQNGPRSLAVGATRVFWSTSDCAIESAGL